ncbi:TrmH family RNA methyltransferase [Microbacterium pseudoresistens]|uniref:TrmH family RNA methyltransferase n=1 Tax=Microbacterium pseudoresistens TaxID=640634 RepID=A0A7Y9ETD5_9MICO|nr:TrmH family RNA methyltransferase [Microbacterium pseudoresistens]NYD53568.1 TrmH family RNA methyltransferase [Microbacterium pseudoresistens]
MTDDGRRRAARDGGRTTPPRGAHTKAGTRTKAVSTRNATFQHWQTLLGNRTKRNRAGEMIVQGVRPITLALDTGLETRAVLVTHTRERTPSRWAAEAIVRAEAAGAERFLVDAELMRELGEKEEDAPEVLLVVAIPPDDPARLPVPADALLVALDRPASPGNIGSITRSIDALGGHGLIVTGHAADPYDPRAVRASTGSTLVTPTVRLAGAAQVLDWVGRIRAGGAPLQVVGTDENGTRDVWDADLTGPTLIVTGNEHSGMSGAWRGACDVLARIPMTGHASSLNAANATTTLLYEALRQRRR